ncbi:MAG: hypothetical protein DRP71_13145 [Verrucomicrobia bacterium]|nr:MAG: hypothetical protein DRP71_13145 [Verrucomicrobiota bacterium]
MSVVLIQFGLWFLRKLLVGTLIVAVGLGLYGLFLYLQENVRVEVERQHLVERLHGELEEARLAVVDLESELDEVHDAIEKARTSADAAERILEGLESLQSYWDWLFLSTAEREEVKRRKQQALKRRNDNRLVEETLRDRLDAISFEQASIQGAIAVLDSHIAELEASPSKAVYYGKRAWERVRIPLMVALFLFFFGPTLWRLFSYYVLGRLIGLARPIVLDPDTQPRIGATTSHVSVDLPLGPDEVLWIKEEFLQASDEALKKRTRFILNWQIPFTCLACGLYELIEIHNSTKRSYSVTTSTQDRPTIEVAVVSIPPEAGAVIRPRFLAGLVSEGNHQLKIKRHWRIFSLQAWITLQFRYFEFRGPCRLVLAGSRGVRSEFLDGVAKDEPTGRRTNQDSTIGFTPDLRYRSTRAETFWSYYRGKNPLFDDLFQGSGAFFCQEISVKGRAGGVRAFWSQLWNAVTKVFGI